MVIATTMSKTLLPLKSREHLHIFIFIFILSMITLNALSFTAAHILAYIGTTTQLLSLWWFGGSGDGDVDGGRDWGAALPESTGPMGNE